jgi:hypothetical protein
LFGPPKFMHVIEGDSRSLATSLALPYKQDQREAQGVPFILDKHGKRFVVAHVPWRFRGAGNKCRPNALFEDDATMAVHAALGAAGVGHHDVKLRVVVMDM